MALGVTVAVLAYGCTGTPKAASTAGRVGLVTGQAAALRLASGVVVDVPKSSVAAAGTLAGQEATAPAAPPAGLAFAGPTYQFRATGAALSGPVTLTFPAPSGPATAGGPNSALLATYDAATAAWMQVPSTYDPHSHVLTATSPLSSIWSVLRLDTAKFIPAVTSALERYIGLAAATTQPVCSDSGQLAADGITVGSGPGLLVKWCAGVSPSGAPLLMVTDSRDYALEVDYPAGWSARLLGPGDPVFRQIVTSVDGHLPATSGDVSSVILPGGGSAEIDAPARASGAVTAVASLKGYLVDTLVFGADTMATTLGDIPGAPNADPTKTAQAVALAFTSKECLDAFDPLANSDIFTAPTAGGIGQLFGRGVKMAVGCLANAMKDAYHLGGANGAFVTSALLWLVEGIKTVLTRARAPVDNDLLLSAYQITIATTGAPAVP